MKRGVLTAALSAFGALSFGQQILFTGATYSENFDGLAASGTANAWSNGATPLSGWYWESITAAQEYDYRADNGGMNTGDLYSYGTTGTAERALGALSSGTTQAIVFGIRIRNSTGFAINSFTFSLHGEQWRNGGNTTATANTLRFSYRADADNTADANEFVGADVQTATGDWSSTNTGGYLADPAWTRVTALDFVSPTITAGAATALDGNLAANQAALNATETLSSLWQPGQDMLFRYVTINNVGNDHGLSIDDLSFTATVVPEPATLGALAVGALAFLRRRRKS